MPTFIRGSENNTKVVYYQGDGFVGSDFIAEFAKYGYTLDKVEIAKPRGLEATFTFH